MLFPLHPGGPLSTPILRKALRRVKEPGPPDVMEDYGIHPKMLY
jgi:hypothetical protein